jgi:hypothetical protein
MQFAAAFIEYLVTGSCGLLWLVPLLSSTPLEVAKLEKVEVALLLPFVYVLGMMIDFVSEKCVSRFKKRIRSAIGASKHNVPSSTVFIAWHSAELAKEFQVRSSRDRIARGAALNFLFLVLVTLLRPSTPAVLHLPVTQPVAVLLFLGLSALCFATWWRCEGLSARFKKHAIDTIVEYPKKGNAA